MGFTEKYEERQHFHLEDELTEIMLMEDELEALEGTLESLKEAAGCMTERTPFEDTVYTPIGDLVKKVTAEVEHLREEISTARVIYDTHRVNAGVMA